jgi:prenyltransferase beta subunit
MKWLLLFALMLAPAWLHADDAKRDTTVKYVLSLQDPATGAFKVNPTAKPTLRACNGGVKVLKTLKESIPHEAELREFVEGCYISARNSFVETDGTADVSTNAVGIMVAIELGIPPKKMSQSIQFLFQNAKTFEEVRLSAAAVEAWGEKRAGFSLETWYAVAAKEFTAKKSTDPVNGGARFAGSYLAMLLRLERPAPERELLLKMISEGQRSDGGWGKEFAKNSDLETCYRICRALKLAKPDMGTMQKLKPGVLKFVESCRNTDGGYAVEPGNPSTLSGTYYAVMIESFLGK